MKAKMRQGKAWLLATARAVADGLMLRSKGTRLRMRVPSRAIFTKTDGWRAVIGDLGKDRLRLEIWFDRITRYPERKLYAAFYAPARQQILAITKRVSRKLWPIRAVNSDDTTEDKYLVFAKRLRRSEFNTPILEKYYRGNTFYGIYDPTRATSERVNRHFCSRAVAFFEEVARALPHAAAGDDLHEVYPQCENRKRVTSHVRRERSGLLATERKVRDEYNCQVCGFRFEKVYGKLGIEFAEAHHRVPLSKLREDVKTSLQDLVTVCANCHRMLHHMEGKRDDVRKLKAIVRNRRRRE